MVLNVLQLNITMENELLNLSECKSPVTLVLHCNYGLQQRHIALDIQLPLLPSHPFSVPYLFDGGLIRPYRNFRSDNIG